jgi:hypothetical protein
MTKPVVHRLGPAGRAALELLGCCPRIPTDIASQLLGHRCVGSTSQVLARLRAMGLVQFETVIPGALLRSRRLRLWSPTQAGRNLPAARGDAASIVLVANLLGGAPCEPLNPARQGVPALVAAYRALGVLTATMQTRPRLRAWEQPWVRTIGSGQPGHQRRVRLPAAGLLELAGLGVVPVLLLPDLGTNPVAGYRGVLNRLLAWRRVTAHGQEAQLVVVTGQAGCSRVRAAAWDELLRRVAVRRGERPLRACILQWPASQEQTGRSSCSGTLRARQVDQVLGLVARHPLLTSVQLAGLLGTTRARIVRLEAGLVDRGWLRPVDAHKCGLGKVGDFDPSGLSSLGLVELTRGGTREAARRLMLSGSQAVRHHGLLGSRARMRQRLLRHIAHTVGANGIFVALARAARAVTRGGGDDALVEWRSAVAVSRGRFRPDGFGVFRRDRARYGFFLEYDRGTERRREYAAKLETYYRYRDTGAAARDYAGFPTVLVVTTRAAAETRFAHEAYLAWERRGGKPLHILLTTTQLIEQSPYGILGPIWRTAGAATLQERVREYWLPGGPPCGPWRSAARNGHADHVAVRRQGVSDRTLRTGSINVHGATVRLARREPP